MIEIFCVEFYVVSVSLFINQSILLDRVQNFVKNVHSGAITKKKDFLFSLSTLLTRSPIFRKYLCSYYMIRTSFLEYSDYIIQKLTKPTILAIVDTKHPVDHYTIST